MRIYLSIFLLSLCFKMNAQEWKLAKNKDGIKVYTRESEGSNLKEFKSSITINNSVEELAKILRDTENQKSWMKDVEVSKKLKDMEDSYYGYYQLNMPWPASDRDMVLFTKEQKIQNGILFDISSAHDYKEEQDGLIRIKKISGGWKFTKLRENSSNVEYWFFVDPAGNLPSWVVNMFIVDGPFETLKELKKIAEQ